MKKFLLFGFLLAIVSIMATGCNSCKSENKQEAPAKEVVLGSANDYDGVLPDITAGVEHITALHRQTMFGLAKGKQYEWRNLQVVFNDVIKTSTLDDLKIMDVTNVFYYWDNGPWVQYITTNVKKGTYIPAKIRDVWIEDCDLSEAQIKLTANDVITKLKEWNGVVPESKGMILRLPLGPRRCNAQWVIGNMADVLFVDAVTGDITNWCPAFPIPNVNGPLGEWP